MKNETMKTQEVNAKESLIKYSVIVNLKTEYGNLLINKDSILILSNKLMMEMIKQYSFLMNILDINVSETINYTESLRRIKTLLMAHYKKEIENKNNTYEHAVLEFFINNGQILLTYDAYFANLNKRDINDLSFPMIYNSPKTIGYVTDDNQVKSIDYMSIDEYIVNDIYNGKIYCNK